MAYREGQTATNPKTGQRVIFKGGQWISAGAATGSPVTGRKLSPQEQKRLNQIGDDANTASEIIRQYRDAAIASKRLKTGPMRGRFLDTATAEDGGGILDTIGAVAVGGPARLLGAITPQETTDFQTLKAIQSRRVLAEQAAQKGVQTEGDAARIKAGDIGPYLTPEANAAASARGIAAAERLIKRAPFYTQWANKYGLNGLNEQGQSVDQAFQGSVADKPNGGRPRVKITRIR